MGGPRARRRYEMSIVATIEEAVVNRLFPILPTWFIRLCLRWYLVYIGWQTRRGDVVVQQIEVDRRQRKARPVTAEVEKANEQLYANDPAARHTSDRGGSARVGRASRRLPRRAADGAFVPGARPPRDAPRGRACSARLRGARSRSRDAERYPRSSRLLELARASASSARGGARPSPTDGARRGLRRLRRPSKSAVAPASAPFDAAVAIETVEHAQNIGAPASGGAAEAGAAYSSTAAPQSASYLMDASTWMGRNFFSGNDVALALPPPAPPSPTSLTSSPSTASAAERCSRGTTCSRRRRAPSSRSTARRSTTASALYVVCAEAFITNNGNEFMCAYYTFVKVGRELARTRAESWQLQVALGSISVS